MFIYELDCANLEIDHASAAIAIVAPERLRPGTQHFVIATLP